MMVDRILPVIDELSDELMLVAKEEAEKKTRQVGEKMARKTRKKSKVQLPDNTENHRLSVIDISEKDEIDKAVSNLISKYTEESKSEFYGIPQRKHVETELVMNMFCDILESRHLASTEGKQAFTGDDLIDALKEYGVGKVDIKQGKWERDLILPNGKYYVENEKYGNSLMAATHETEFWHYRKSIRVTGLTAKETARYIVEFDDEQAADVHAVTALPRPSGTPHAYDLQGRRMGQSRRHHHAVIVRNGRKVVEKQ